MNWNETIPDDFEVVCLHINSIDMSIITVDGYERVNSGLSK